MTATADTTRVALRSGATVDVPTRMAGRFAGLDANGDWIVEDPDLGHGYRYALTPCCHASGKGHEDGIVCRACYQVVDDYYGGPADPVTDPVMATTNPVGPTPYQPLVIDLEKGPITMTTTAYVSRADRLARTDADRPV